MSMGDLRHLLLLGLLVVLGLAVTLLWLSFGSTPPQPLPLGSLALFLGLMAPTFILLQAILPRSSAVIH